MEHSTYHKLVIAAANLLRQKGYAGTGISDILKNADVTRGSLYHHFPGGKSDLAIAAAHYSADQLLRHIEVACKKAHAAGGDYQDAMIELCKKIYEIYESNVNWRFMTVSATLQDGGKRNELFSREARKLGEKIKLKAIAEGAKFGLSEEESYMPLRKAMLMLEGGWLLGRVQNNPLPMQWVLQFVEEEKKLQEMRSQLSATLVHDYSQP
nr:TetR/AcrR family transcriptional regulator [uncultured Cohaesibacter sp.]